MGKSEIDAKVEKIRKAAEDKIRAKHETQIERELDAVEVKARKYFEEQEEPDVSLFLERGSRKRGGGSGTRSCAVCGLPGTRNTFKGAKKDKHTREEHEEARAG